MGFKFNALTGSLDIDTKTTDAESIQGVSVSNSTPTDNQIIRYDSATEAWEIEDLDLGPYVVGPSSSTDNAIPRYDGTTGKLIQDYTSNAPTITDDGVASFPDNDHANSERIGAGSSVGGANATVYGNAANALGNGTAIGQDAECVTSTFGTALGFRAYSRNFGTTALGANTIASGVQSVAVGVNAQATNTFSFALGAGCRSNNQYNICMGGSVISNHDRFMGFGRQITSTQTGQAIFGGTFNVIHDFYLGGQPQGNRRVDIERDSHLFFPFIAGTTDESARDAYIDAPAGTGTGNGGHLYFRTAPATTTGSTTNPWQVVFELTDEREAKFSGAVHKPIETLTTDTTLDSSHWTVLIDTSGGDVTITLPTNVDGRVYNIKKISSDVNQVILSGTVDGGVINLTTQYESITIQNQTTNWWIL